jgi:MoaA/NifB/PqqE/SkfB family radical SAM enzyme
MDTFNKSIRNIFTAALEGDAPNSARFSAVLETIRNQGEAARKRREWGRKGIHVPPIMILSVTDRCNLECSGCYARHQFRRGEGEITEERLFRIMEEARELGISIVPITGGEPLMRRDLLACTREFPETLFLLFTNGLLVDKGAIRIMKERSNIVPVLSMDGDERHTDSRRGTGTFRHNINVMKTTKDAGVFFGVSLTVTRENFEIVSNEVFIESLIDSGSKLFFFITYLPLEEGTEHLSMTSEQAREMEKTIDFFKSKYPVLFLSFPGGEEKEGGCLAAGGRLFHVNPYGDVEPCPFSPCSDSNLREISLKEAMQSSLLKSLRGNRDRFTGTREGCPLWEKRDWISSR